MLDMLESKLILG